MTKIEALEIKIRNEVPFIKAPRFARWDSWRYASDDYATLEQAVCDDAQLDFYIHPHLVRTVGEVSYYTDSTGQKIILVSKEMQKTAK